MELKESFTYYCYRPTLATKLAADGYTFKRTTSPWKADRFVWIFDLDKRGVQIVADYFTEMGKPVPEFLKGALAK